MTHVLSPSKAAWVPRGISAGIFSLVLLALAGSLQAQNRADTPPASTSSENAVVPPRTSPAAGSEAADIMESVRRNMSTPVLKKRNPRYLLRPGDVVEINFELAPAFNQVRSVQPDGYIALQNVGDLHVSGMDIPELSAALKKQYSAIMRDPVVTVILKEFEHPYFIVSGQVAKPGKYELRGGSTVTEAIAIAGGFGEVAKSSRVLLFRRVSNDSVDLKELNVKKMLKDGKLHEDVELQPGDLVYVPKSTTAQVLKALLPRTNTGLYIPLGK